jgi:hypothetical protein
VPVAAADQHPVLVDPEVSRRKVQREVDWWRANASTYRRRGWILIDHRDLVVEMALAAPVQITGPGPLPILSACFRLDFSNYDLWPPSLRFIDLFTGEPSPPHVGAVVVENGQPVEVLLEVHPTTGLPFLCLPGIREYHDHPQHTGDDWLLYRNSGAGSLVTICDRVWRYMVRNVVGLRVTLQACLPPVATQFDIRLVQGDIDALIAQVATLPAVTAPA